MRFAPFVRTLGLAAGIVPAALAAQVGATTDIITGKVTGPGGIPIPNARVEVTSVELDVMRARTTNDKGQYTLLFPDGGGQYRIVVKVIGMAPATTTVVRQADEDRLVADVQLSPITQRLNAVTVQATPNPNGSDERPTPGSTERSFTTDQLFRLPVDASDPMAVAGLAAGVISLSGSDSTSASFSVAGQRADQNQITLDGLSLGSGSVPSEAVRSTRVITNTYDVARGQFTGGQVSSTTRSGTNVLQGSFGYVANEPELEFPDEQSAQFGQKYTQNRLSFGLGGPLKKDAAFWFGSLQWTGRQTGLQSLLSANEAILERNNASPDSVERFIAAIHQFGIPVSTGAVPLTSNRDGLTGLSRLDFTLGDNHTMTIRNDWNWSSQDANRISALSLPAHGGSLSSLGGGMMVSLSSQWDNGIINQGQIYGQKRTSDTDPFLRFPQGTVRITSDLPDGTTALSNVSFGGNASMPTNQLSNMLEFSDEVSYLGAAHRLKLGTLVNVTGNDNDLAANRNGSFTFNSLADFQNGVPASYTRLLTPNTQKGDAVNAAVYLGDTWRKSRGLQVVYGVRVEGSRYDGRPAYNPLVEQSFGRRTDDFPSEVHASPRIGFTWTSVPPNQRRPGDTTSADGRGGRGSGGFGGGGFGGGRGGGGFGGRGGGMGAALAGFSQTIIRGGIGEFRGRAPTQLFSSAINANGLANGESQLVCVGAAAPVPDWSRYLADPTAIPDECADGSTGAGDFSSTARNVTTFAPDFTVPRTWRASLGGQHRILDRYTVSLDLTYALGTHLYGVRDLNLNTAAPRFTLAGEGNRPVYVNPTAIVPSTGAVNSLDARVVQGLGAVYDITSNLQSDARQATLSISGFTPQGIQMALSYTYLRSRDQSSSSGGSASGLFSGPTTAGDPNALQWATSDNERRHQILLTANWPVHPSVDITGVFRVTSGQPYTPRVSGDINGDGSRNDRAFIYDPAAAPDTSLANGMTQLLTSAPAGVRSCLRSQLGQIASRNSCTAPWYPSLDFQVNYRPDRLGLRRNLMLSFSFTNPLAGLDQLLHGSDGLQGWGQAPRVDPNLLFVRGFDPVQDRFLYQVNERFGTSRGQTTLTNPNPFMIAVTARLTVGPDRQRAGLLAMQNAARGGRGGRGTAFADSAGGAAGAQVRRFAPNVFRQILAQDDSLGLHLTSVQVAELTRLQDSLYLKVDTLAVRLQAKMQSLGNNAEPGALQIQIRPLLVDAQQLGLTSVHQAQVILTPEQWAKLPDRIKHPQAIFGPAPGAGGRGGRGGPPPMH
ncbi:MAG TPA: carboxypeptidase regulatory-like domain-containing protein [Gemmatimonadaceae bacterium]|nr:carboxypeptidase regulatory-like domain-containing protein [Gemmatimonadaceae bacterium]